MAGVGSFAARRLRALEAAQQTLDDLGLDPTGPIDVFGAIERLGLWVTFLPLQNLLGATVPRGNGGVLITSERPAAVQRFTAAHEIGHWILDQDELALDGELEVHGTPPAERERLAQVFAGYFVMPPPLLHGTAARHGIRRGGVPSPAQVYLTARDVGASYEAVVRQLHNLDYYTWSDLRSLLRVRPLAAKQDAAYGVRPRDGRANVWPLDPQQNDVHLDVEVGDEIVLALPENRTTGYRWLTEDQEHARHQVRPRSAPPSFSDPPVRRSEPSAPRVRALPTAAAVRDALSMLPAAEPRASATTAASDAPLSVVNDEFRASWATLAPAVVSNLRRRIAGDRNAAAPAAATGVPWNRDSGVPIGSTGQRILAVRAGVEGEATLRLTLAPPYDPDGEPAAVLSLTSTARLRPADLHRRRLLAIDVDRREPDDPPDDAEFAVDPDDPTEPRRQ